MPRFSSERPPWHKLFPAGGAFEGNTPGFCLPKAGVLTNLAIRRPPPATPSETSALWFELEEAHIRQGTLPPPRRQRLCRTHASQTTPGASKPHLCGTGIFQPASPTRDVRTVAVLPGPRYDASVIPVAKRATPPPFCLTPPPFHATNGDKAFLFLGVLDEYEVPRKDGSGLCARLFRRYPV